MLISVLTGIFIVTTLIYCGWALYFLRGLSRRYAEYSDEKPFVSVVIAARNEEETIGACLASLLRQTYPADRYEIILADDQSGDETRPIAARMAERHPNLTCFTITEISEGYSPKKNALRQAIMRSRGELILTTDADCIAPPGWIAGMAGHFTENVGMVAGFSLIDWERKGERRLLAAVQALDFLALMSAAAGGIRMGRPQAASGQNLAYRKSAFDRAGGFEEVRHRVSGDDVLLLQLIRRKTGMEIRFADPADTAVTTRAVPSWPIFIRQRMRWASNSEMQRFLDPGFFFYLMSVFILSLGMIAFPILSCFEPSLLPVWAACAFLKFAMEYLVLARGKRFAGGRNVPLAYFPIWFVLQPVLLIIAGIGGLFVKISWKGRTFAER